MFSSGSFDQILITKEEQTCPLMHNTGKSLAMDFGFQLPERSIPVELDVDEEVIITYIYPRMDKLHALIVQPFKRL